MAENVSKLIKECQSDPEGFLTRAQGLVHALKDTSAYDSRGRPDEAELMMKIHHFFILLSEGRPLPIMSEGEQKLKDEIIKHLKN